MRPVRVIWLLVAATAAQAADRVVWDFEDEKTRWAPVEKTILLQRDTGTSASPSSKTSLHMHGPIRGGWNYAWSVDRHVLDAGGLYRLSGWVRVRSLGPDTPSPYFKCELGVDAQKNDLGRRRTDRYDASRLDTWQRLSVEFRAPAGVGKVWVALEKGTHGPARIDTWIDDVVLERIEKLTVLERYRLDPLPVPLAERKGVHPRLYVDAARVGRLRRAIGTTHAGLWRKVRAQADRAARSAPPRYRNDRGEQNWQRRVGNTMALLAAAWAVGRDRRHLDAARKWALASCSYPTWGHGRLDGRDLAAGHQLFGLAIVYDWCHADLDEATRRTIRQTLVRRGRVMFETGATDTIYWTRSYLQNHLWVSLGGLAAAGLAIIDEHPDAACWVGLAAEKFKRTARALGPDGASHEGVGYWGYGVEYLLKFMHLARDLLELDLHDSDWWRNTAYYRLYLGLPRNAWTRQNCIVDIADCPRCNWYGPDYLLRYLAREYRNGHAQWLADAISRAGVDNSEQNGWLNLVWFDPAVKPAPPDDLPTLRHFADMGIVSARSDWSGDESLVVFKCGPFIGRHAAEAFSHDPGGGHVHPDANHFVVFGAGQWLLRDDGYQDKWTRQHNTLLIDGRGQDGEGATWFQGAGLLARRARPKILRAVSGARLDHIAGDATEAYPPDAGLRRFVRHLLFLKPDVLVVADDVVLAEARPLELRFHTEQQARPDGKGRFLARGPRANLLIEPLTGQGVACSADRTRMGGTSDTPDRMMFSVRLSKRAVRWRNAVAVSWSGRAAQPARVVMQIDGDRWIFTAGDRAAVLDWSTGQARLK